MAQHDTPTAAPEAPVALTWAAPVPACCVTAAAAPACRVTAAEAPDHCVTVVHLDCPLVTNWDTVIPFAVEDFCSFTYQIACI